MGEFIEAEVEIKLNSEHYDFVQCGENDENKIVLQQFKGESELVYLTLNGAQVTISAEDLKVAANSMYERQLNEERNKSKVLETEILEMQLKLESLKLKEMEK